MKESRFIAQNKEKWREAETLLQSSVKDPEKLSNLFIQVVDDLSYSRTYYPNRSVRVYLNRIAKQYFSVIYSNRKEKHNRFLLFWLDELPQVILYCKRPMLISLAVFLLAIGIGVFSSANDPQFVNTILGDDYVSMTNENIKKNDPMAVYKKQHEVDMFLGITYNNLMVAFRTYVLGIFLGLGTLASLLSNGIMVGSFQYFFFEHGLFVESALTIWLHGTLEISAIILAGGAGLTLSSGLIFPGTYSRIQSLQISGIRSLKLMLGIAPVFVLAAIIESFLTRYTDAPTFLKLILIILSAAYIVGYFVVYPWLKSKKGFKVPLKDVRLPATNNEPVIFNRIKTNADLLKDTFQFYYRNSKTLLSWAAIVSIGVSVAWFFLIEENEPVLITRETWWVTFFSGIFFGVRTPSVPFIFINALATAVVVYRVMMLIDAEAKKTPFSINIQSFIQLYVISAMIYTGVYFDVVGALLLLGAFGFLIFTAFVQLTERSGLLYGMGHGWTLFWNNKNQGLYLQAALVLLSVSFLMVLSAPLFYAQISILKWNFVATDELSGKILAFVELFAKTISFYLVLPIVAASMSYLYFSQDEANSATHLRELIGKMGVRPSKK